MKRVLITGATSGIGLQLALDYAQQGWHVFACGRSEEKLSQVFSTSHVQTVCFNATDKQATFAACKDIQHLDLVILNAGTCEYIDNPLAFDSALFQRVINTNVLGTAYCLEALLPKLKSGATLALMSSSATLLPFSRAEAYGASKAAIDYLAESLAVDLYRHNISVSTIKPCFVDTPLTQKNDFAMPGSIDVNTASRYIRKGLAKKRAVVSFTPWFIGLLKLLQWLPRSWWQKLQTKEYA